ncbi:MAG TPA: nucleotidyl transferase AbiEii/AbiGii toxin family protein [Thermoplasmata archaeon]|nr:nucleotidyl transferase AbiEii/AbiGii toxin family protein [Thermoplasmata archaeon]
MRPQDLARERAGFALLGRFRGTRAVLVGGYAVSAYGPPRFSLDLDFVLPASALPAIRGLLKSADLAWVRDWEGGADFAGRAERWSRGEEAVPLSVDLLIDGISDRVSGASHPYASVRRGARRLTVRGLDPSSEARALVAAPEVLVALKLEAGRRVDLRDLAVLAGTEIDTERIATLLRSVRRDVLREHLDALASALERRDFQDSLQGVYMLDERAFRRVAIRTEGLLRDLRAALLRLDRRST